MNSFPFIKIPAFGQGNQHIETHIQECFDQLRGSFPLKTACSNNIQFLPSIFQYYLQNMLQNSHVQSLKARCNSPARNRQGSAILGGKGILLLPLGHLPGLASRTRVVQAQVWPLQVNGTPSPGELLQRGAPWALLCKPSGSRLLKPRTAWHRAC